MAEREKRRAGVGTEKLLRNITAFALGALLASTVMAVTGLAQDRSDYRSLERELLNDLRLCTIADPEQAARFQESLKQYLEREERLPPAPAEAKAERVLQDRELYAKYMAKDPDVPESSSPGKYYYFMLERCRNPL